MSVSGLKRKPYYEEVLNAAIKSEHSQHGILSVGLQNFATRSINNPLFQRIHEGITEIWETNSGLYWINIPSNII
jgi:hypothetical protein